MKKPTVIELFAGAGGLAIGLENAGFDPLLLNDNDRYSTETLKMNRPSWNVILEDVREITKKGIKNYYNYDVDVDLVSGGFPCQTFSYAGKKLGFNDTRGTLFYEFAKIVSEVKPKIFFAENVKGLVSHNKGRTLSTMIDVFESIGYSVEYKVLNSANYSVPQKRHRIIIIGIRYDIKEKETVSFKYPEPNDQIITLREALKDVPESPHTHYSEKKAKVLDLVPSGGNWRNLPKDVAKEYMGKSYYLGGGKTGVARRMSWDEPGLTVLCSPSQKQTERCHPEETRPFTIRENARIQCFPDDWKFCGSISQQYKQIGNAVPVKLAEAVGKSISYYLVNN